MPPPKGCPSDLVYFRLDEFRHPDLVDPRAARTLDAVRGEFGAPIFLTDDARLPGEAPPGASPTSLHYLGQAFDIRCRTWSPERMWAFVQAVQLVAGNLPADEAGVELEVVWSAVDRHAHVGFYLNGHTNRLIIRAD